ncbi:DUF6101 family protein [Alsobacter sp. SYSU M60028]|uniref:DUF6101 family protein n=1 Tax=Alsobacter ponti TaxID=2962936 RepID=A0ABT1LEP7_9HYPH|nr:DUF6101 family protein [Alsobacter ponti]MCP8939215.1 DUF6101 family protein [Alsobacter ponti]
MWSSPCEQDNRPEKAAAPGSAPARGAPGAGPAPAPSPAPPHRSAASGRPTGVVLRRRAEPDGRELYEVAIAFGGGRAETPVHLAADDETVIARWQGFARELGLKLIVEAEDGAQTVFYEQIGAVRLGERHSRRRPGALLRRRPRFLTRRRPGRMPESPAVHREREIIARS